MQVDSARCFVTWIGDGADSHLSLQRVPSACVRHLSTPTQPKSPRYASAGCRPAVRRNESQEEEPKPEHRSSHCRCGKQLLATSAHRTRRPAAQSSAEKAVRIPNPIAGFNRATDRLSILSQPTRLAGSRQPHQLREISCGVEASLARGCVLNERCIIPDLTAAPTLGGRLPLEGVCGLCGFGSPPGGGGEERRQPGTPLTGPTELCSQGCVLNERSILIRPRLRNWGAGWHWRR